MNSLTCPIVNGEINQWLYRMPERIVLLGSTGSIGTQALDVISRYPDKFEVETLTAGDNIDLLTTQARQVNPRSVVIGNRKHYAKLKENLSDTGIRIEAGDDAMEQCVTGSEVDVVIAA